MVAALQSAVAYSPPIDSIRSKGAQDEGDHTVLVAGPFSSTKGVEQERSAKR